MIAWRGVSKGFESHAKAVDDVTLQAKDGGFLAVVGESGSGKSTLLKMVNRLVEPDAGRVEIDGQPVADGPAPALRRRIGYVFQGIGLFPHLDLAENIGVTPRLLGWPKARIAMRVDALLDLVRLPRAYAGRAPHQLSGGQRQRVGIARAHWRRSRRSCCWTKRSARSTLSPETRWAPTTAPCMTTSA